MLMPVNRSFPLDMLKSALMDYQRSTHDRITLEIVLIGNRNASEHDAEMLAQWIAPLRAQVNLIAWNPIEGMDFILPTAAQIRAFSRVLEAHGFTTVQRMSRGRGVMGACGQLGETLAAQTTSH